MNNNTKERESIEFDVLFVGGGPASLSGALHLSNLIKRGKQEKGQGEISIAIIEKGVEIGSHALSGAIMDPCGLRELIPDFESNGFPFEKMVTEDEIYLLTKKGRFRFPVIPPPLRNHGNYIISLYKFVRWLGKLAEDSGVDIFPGFPGVEVLYDGDRITGVRTGDKGVDKDGNPGGNFEAGVDIKAKVTVFGEGPRGTLTKQLTNRFNLSDGKNPQVYSTGVKEVWEMHEGKADSGKVIHTMGYPLKSESFGGGFIYNMSNNLLAIGFVAGLDYKDPWLDPHRELQKFKKHPFVASLLEGGKLAHYGAKTIPDGGYFSMPGLSVAGGLIIGDSGSFLNPQRLKGIHLAIKSGMLAAETIHEAFLKDDFSEDQMGRFQTGIDNSWIKEELYRARNFRQGFKYGFYPGMVMSGVQMLTGGRWLKKRLECNEDHTHMKKVLDYYKGDSHIPEKDIKFDEKLTFSKLTDVYYSGTKHEKNQPPHLKIADYDICNKTCKEEYGNPCQYFCPANVYEMAEDEESGETFLQLNPENCVHCKTCDIADPYQVITWVPPEGGGGPNYVNL